MNENSEQYNELVVKYFSGEATPEEIDRLSQWLSSDPLNKRTFEEYRQVWLLTAKNAFALNVNLDTEWEKLQSRTQKVDEISHASKSTIRPVNHIKSKGKIRSINVPLMAAASVIIMVILAGVLHFTVLRTHTITVVATNSNREILLPDGSEIILAEGSTLEYPEAFKRDSRKVDLVGQAHFNVTHDKNRPFIVSTDELHIKVLGTRFNVNSKASHEKVSVVLESGSVALYFNENRGNEIILNPGERADISITDKNIVKAGNSDNNYNAWLTGVIEFNNTSMQVVANTLSQTFAKEVKLRNEHLAGCTLTATFKDQSLDEVLGVIQATLDIRVIQKDNVIYLDGNCR